MENQSKTSLRTLKRAGIATVLLHLVVSMVHSSAHLNLHIDLNAWQSVYILSVILVLPLISAVLLLRKRARIGFWLLFGSMLGSLLFGGYYHFIAAGADNVASLGDHAWAPAFQVTVVLLALTEAAGMVIGGAGLRNGNK